jgi:endo-1,4-beta-D-glucanase Y/plastocyanin
MSFALPQAWQSLQRSAAVLLVGLTLSATAAASNYPYPQAGSLAYSYGFKPASPLGATWTTDYNSLLTKYNNWKGVNVTSSGAGGYLRVQRPANSNDTVSEGISYGMLMAVYFDDQATFDKLWSYKQIHNDGLGLMNWNINSGGGTQNANSATDADEDIAYSLYLASYQWGTGAYGSIVGTSYKTLADAEVNKLKLYDLNGSLRVKPGDSYDSCRYPSYFFPNEYRVFAKQTNDSYSWDNARNTSYATIAAARNSGTGLIAEQTSDTGPGGGCGVSSTQYQYNSCRVPFRMALDYVYYGDANASGEMGKLQTFFGSIAPGSVVDCYNLAGSSCGSFNNSAFVGPAACSMMLSGGANLQTYYNNLMSTNDTSYFSGALQILSLLLLQGNMPNIADPASIYTPTVTATPTNYAGSPTSTRTATPIAFGYVFEDGETGAMTGAYTYNGTGSSITASNTNTQANNGSNSIKVAVTVAASSYAGVGFSSPYANGFGVVDATGSNAVRFAIKSDSNVTFVLQFREAGNTTTAVAGGDGELWDSPPITVGAGAGWQNFTIPIVFSGTGKWTEDLYSSNGAAGNNTMNLSAMQVCQLNFSSAVTGANLYFDDIAFVPAVAPSPTSTRTPFNNPYTELYDDFEAPMSLSQPARASTYADTAHGASASWSLDTSNYVAGAKSAKLTYNSGTGTSYGAGGFDISPYGTPQLYVDASGAAILAFWINAPAGLKYQMEFQEAGTPTSPTAGTADGEAWLSSIQTAAGGGWQYVQLEIGAFTEDPYNPICTPNCLSGASAGNGTKDLQAISSVTIKVMGNQGSGSLNLDDLAFITTWKTPTPTISPSGTATSSLTPSPATTPTQTLTATGTRSATPTPTPSASPSYSATPTPTRTPSMTPSISPSFTFSPTPTNFAGSPTNTPAVSPTASPSTTPALDAWDPADDSTSGATVIPVLTPGVYSFSNGHLTSPTDMDYYELDVIAGRTYGVTATRTSGGTGLNVEALNSSMIILTNTAGTTSDSLSFMATYTGIYWVMVTSNQPLGYNFSAADLGTTTATPTRTASPTISPTFSISPTATITLTATQTCTPTVAPPTATRTDTPLPGSPTSTLVVSATSSPTPAGNTPSSTPTLTLTYSNTWTFTPVPPTNTFTPTPTPMIQDLGFTWSPSQLTVTAGTTVTWGWVGFHNVVSDTGLFNSGAASSPGSFAFTFNTVGTYPYHCAIHGSIGMTGTIFVISAPTPTPVPASTSVPDAPQIILRSAPFPNPVMGAGSLRVQLAVPVDGLSCKFYTKAMILVGNLDLGALPAGWSDIALPSSVVGQPAGSYFYVLRAKKNGSADKPVKSGRLVVLH